VDKIWRRWDQRERAAADRLEFIRSAEKAPVQIPLRIIRCIR
jgi:hypothetical protein